jgi:hypothetical protein
MRDYIRHPSDIPIEYSFELHAGVAHESLTNVSGGGLAFHSHIKLDIGTMLKIRIPTIQADFEARGRVARCRHIDDNGFEVGVALVDEDNLFRSRMVEQICQIECYRRQVARDEGRDLSGEAAAREWIDRYAADFSTV